MDAIRRKLLKLGRVKRAANVPTPPSVPAADLIRHRFGTMDSLAFPPLAQACFDRLLNNDLTSDCTCVTAMKCAAAILGDAGTSIIFSNAQAEDLYRGACGWDGTAATNNGGIPDDVIDYVTAHGLEKNLHHYAGKVKVDGTNPDEVRRVVLATKNLYLGADLPDAWLQASNGSVLTYAGGPVQENGHAFPAGGRGGFYTAEGLVLTLWGGIECLCPWDVLARFMTEAAGGEMHSMISHDMIRKGETTTSLGLDWDLLSERFKALGGTVA